MMGFLSYLFCERDGQAVSSRTGNRDAAGGLDGIWREILTDR